ncbi:MAG: hypothetical protein AAFV53_32385 [Myxococcota bacterium]
MLPRLLPLLALSGAAALTCESVWLRRLALATGSAGIAATLTLAVYMAGLGIGGVIGGRVRWRQPPAGYGVLELLAAGWAILFPLLLQLTAPLALQLEGIVGAGVIAVLLLLPPALLHGATLPAAAASLERPDQVAGLYAVNTLGAVAGSLLAAFLFMPAAGVRGTELIAAALGAAAGIGAIQLRREAADAPPPRAGSGWLPAGVLLAAAVAGGGAMALEVVWSRLAALLIGGSVYGMAIVLAVFLAGVALGAEWGRRVGSRAVRPGLAALGLLALAGTLAWRFLPHGLGVAWTILGADGQLLSGAILMAMAMFGAPVASGVVFSACLQVSPSMPPARAAGQVLGANTLGAVLGVSLAGLFGMPALGIRGVVILVSVLCVLCAAFLPMPHDQPRPPIQVAVVGALLGLALLTPRWDPALYAVGLYNRINEFVDLSPRAVERFAHDGWTLEFYEDGRTASVAIGRGTKSGNIWLSINGKVDASTGADMPTQQLSGRLPVAISGRADPEALVVGLASGVTAYEALASGASAVTVVELEPAVVRASRAFADVNGDLHNNPRADVRVDDARAYLARPGRPFPIIISEPSNPWLTGVSNLFTHEYWRLARGRLTDDGVFCQWLQLYTLPPQAMRSLVRTFIDVFPQSWLFESIPGADALLIAAPSLPQDLPIKPTLGPEQLRRLAGAAPRNTDDQPWIEFEAPRWLHQPTGKLNQQLIEAAAQP